MDFPLDNFITYPQSPGVEFPLNLAQDDLFPPGYLSTPDMDKLGSFPSESGQTNHTSPLGSDSHASTGLESVKTKTTKELKQVSLSTKQIKKKQLDQERAEKKDRELAQLLAKASKKYIPPALYDPNLDPKTKRHLIQVVKNRMAAQQTRDRRKAEVEEFDEVKQRLEDENKRLLDQNSYLMERLRKLEENQMRIMSENQHLKHQQANQAMQSSFMTQSQFMQNQAALNNSYMTQPSMSKSMQMPMPMQMSTNRSFVIDPSDEEKTLVNLVPGGAGPVLTRGTAKRTPFGYVFSLTTILLVFQSLTISPVPLSKQGPNSPAEPNNPTSNGGDDTGHYGTWNDPTNPGGLPSNPGDPTHGGGQPQDPPGSDFIPPVENGGTMSDPVSHDPVPGGDVGPIHVDVFEGNGTNTTTAGSENNTGSETDNSTLDVIGPEDPLPPENSSETAIDPPDGGSDDEDRENIEGSSNLNRLLKRTESSSEEISLESILSRPKRFLGKLDDKINNELGRRH